MNFLGIGYQEIALILVAALVVFGPTRLPEVAGQAARFLRDARKMMTELSGEFEKNAGVQEFKSAIEGEIAGVKKELEGAGVSVRKDLQSATNSVNNSVKSAAAAASSKPGAKKPASTTSTTTAAATSSTTKAKPKASKADPFAGLVALPEVTPKATKAAAVVSNGATPKLEVPTEPLRETSEAVMRARERRATAGYNRRVSAP
jgi:sec-independent protein translocase protein TatB